MNRKKTSRRLNRFLSLLVTLAMLLTLTPWAGLPVSASEPPYNPSARVLQGTAVVAWQDSVGREFNDMAIGTYDVSFWMKGTGTVRLGTYNTSPAASAVSGADAAATSEWTRHTATWTVTAAGKVRIQFAVVATGTFFLDDIRISMQGSQANMMQGTSFGTTGLGNGWGILNGTKFAMADNPDYIPPVYTPNPQMLRGFNTTAWSAGVAYDINNLPAGLYNVSLWLKGTGTLQVTRTNSNGADNWFGAANTNGDNRLAATSTLTKYTIELDVITPGNIQLRIGSATGGAEFYMDGIEVVKRGTTVNLLPSNSFATDLGAHSWNVLRAAEYTIVNNPDFVLPDPDPAVTLSLNSGSFVVAAGGTITYDAATLSTVNEEVAGTFEWFEAGMDGSAIAQPAWITSAAANRLDAGLTGAVTITAGTDVVLNDKIWFTVTYDGVTSPRYLLAVIPPPVVSLPSEGTHNYQFMPEHGPASADEIEVIYVPVSGHISDSHGDWSKYLLLVLPEEPLENTIVMKWLKYKGVYVIGGKIEFEGKTWATPVSGTTPVPGDHVISIGFTGNAPAGTPRPFVFLANIDFDVADWESTEAYDGRAYQSGRDVKSYWGDFFSTGGNAANQDEWSDAFMQKINIERGHYFFGSGAPDNNQSHADVFQTTRGAWRSLYAANMDINWYGQVFFLVPTDISDYGQNVAHPEGRAILKDINAKPMPPLPLIYEIPKWSNNGILYGNNANPTDNSYTHSQDINISGTTYAADCTGYSQIRAISTDNGTINRSTGNYFSVYMDNLNVLMQARNINPLKWESAYFSTRGNQSAPGPESRVYFEYYKHENHAYPYFDGPNVQYPPADPFPAREYNRFPTVPAGLASVNMYSPAYVDPSLIAIGHPNYNPAEALRLENIALANAKLTMPEVLDHNEIGTAARITSAEQLLQDVLGVGNEEPVEEREPAVLVVLFQKILLKKEDEVAPADMIKYGGITIVDLLEMKQNVVE